MEASQWTPPSPPIMRRSCRRDTRRRQGGLCNFATSSSVALPPASPGPGADSWPTAVAVTAKARQIHVPLSSLSPPPPSLSPSSSSRPKTSSRPPWPFSAGLSSPMLQICLVLGAWLLIGAACFVRPASGLGTSGFYADENMYPGRGQTVLLNRIPGEHRRALKREILALLGLHHRPRPTSHGKFNSAPSYMLNLYKTLNVDDIDEEGEEEDAQNGTGPPSEEDAGREGSARRAGGGVPAMVRRRIATHNLTLPGMEEYAGGADMIASFINRAGHRENHRLRHERNRMFYFDFREVPVEMAVTGAELRIYKRASSGYHLNNGSLTIEIYRVYEDHRKQYEKSIVLEANVTVSTQFDGWIDVNVTAAAAQWNFFPVTNHGLYMMIKNDLGESIEPSRAGVVDLRGPDDKQAFLVAFFKASQEIRSRRTRGAGRRHQRTEVTYNDEPSGHGGWGPNIAYRTKSQACHRQQLYVSFEDLGWQDWIIAPKGYSAFYCLGECLFPLSAHMNATNHAIVQTLVHLMNPQQAPKPSCAPTELSSISVLYFDDNSNVILKKYRNMEWIIAPDMYHAYYCSGECSFPLNVHMNATNHAIVQTLVHHINPNQVPKPSCAPKKLSAISVLFFDDNSNVILKKFKNMVVRSCGCH